MLGTTPLTFKVGDRARVIGGAWEGMIGKVARVVHVYPPADNGEQVVCVVPGDESCRLSLAASDLDVVGEFPPKVEQARAFCKVRRGDGYVCCIHEGHEAEGLRHVVTYGDGRREAFGPAGFVAVDEPQRSPESPRVTEAAIDVVVGRKERARQWLIETFESFRGMPEESYVVSLHGLLAEEAGKVLMAEHRSAEPVRGPSDAQSDWTVSAEGRANSSEMFLALVGAVGEMVHNAHVGDASESLARTILAQLAHVHGLAPREGGRHGDGSRSVPVGSTGDDDALIATTSSSEPRSVVGIAAGPGRARPDLTSAALVQRTAPAPPDAEASNEQQLASALAGNPPNFDATVKMFADHPGDTEWIRRSLQIAWRGGYACCVQNEKRRSEAARHRSPSPLPFDVVALAKAAAGDLAEARAELATVKADCERWEAEGRDFRRRVAVVVEEREALAVRLREATGLIADFDRIGAHAALFLGREVKK